MGDFEGQAQALLRQLTRRSNAVFREGQLEAISTVVQNRSSALVVQATGWGKSAVYFISTKMIRDESGAPTVIVSPLVALMRNQVEMARSLGLTAANFNSTTKPNWQHESGRIRDGLIDLAFVTPETLNSEQFRSDILPSLVNRVGLLVIDEVHCISDWGHDFRPDYRRLRDVVSILPPGIPVLATTATANERVIRDVEVQLGTGMETFRGSLDRNSLRLHVLDMPNKAHRMAWLAKAIPDLPGSGIVYCLTVRDTEAVAQWLRRCEIDAVAYSADLDDKTRQRIEEDLDNGNTKVVVATSALGMGYDNPHIKFVIHYQVPGSPLAYYQQVGRAGRAVDESYGIALSGWEDRDIRDYFIKTAFPSRRDTEAALEALSKAKDGMTQTQLERTVNLSRSRIESMLKNLEVEGAINRDKGRWFRSARTWTYPSERIDAVLRYRRQEHEVMDEYVRTDACLMEFLRRELDDPWAERCGRCSNCTGQRLSPEVDPALSEQALLALAGTDLIIEPRKHAPSGLTEAIDLSTHRVEQGRCLTRWGDPGLAELIPRGRNRDQRFDDRLIDAAVALIGRWNPQPHPTWLTWIPSSTDLVKDFTERLATRLGLEAVPALRRVSARPPQKTMANSSQQAANILGAFEVTDIRSGPVLLIDDAVDSRWTFTIAGGQLRSAGSGPVYPLALTDTSQRGP